VAVLEKNERIWMMTEKTVATPHGNGESTSNKQGNQDL